MKISELWLREWTNPPIVTAQLAEQLTMAGLEVGSVSPVAGSFDQVVIAQVLEVTRHPQADRLSLCVVQSDLQNKISPYQVVCGAPNVRAGLKVAFALPGAHLPGGVHIKETMLRGCLSQGMLCSTTELGIEESSEGIWELPDDAPIGALLRDYLALDDHVLDIELTPNRGDCLSVLGVAREVAALNHLPVPQWPTVQIESMHQIMRKVQVHETKACPRYLGRIIQGVRRDVETPLWLQERLRRVGLRTLHPVIDVTNYVMLTLGQPLHAFDQQKLTGDIHVRWAKPDESLTLLDGKSITLHPKVLLIADDQQPLAMAGIMGGERSAVHDETTDIFIESALFNAEIISGVAREYGLTTDAALRYERGVDPNLQQVALDYATALLQSIVGGEVGPITEVVTFHRLPVHTAISFRPERVAQLTGLCLSDEAILSLLQTLNMQIEIDATNWLVTPPSYRYDVSIEEDLVEEVLRRYGYHHLKPQSFITSVHVGQEDKIECIALQASLLLQQRGYHETINYSFVDPVLQHEIYPQSIAPRLMNPLSSELSDMRAGLWPGLIAAMIYNKNRQRMGMRLFETGVVFHQIDAHVREIPCIAGLLTGQPDQLHWSQSSKNYDFFDIKGDVEALFKQADVKELQYAAAQHPALHPGQTAQIIVAGNEVGWVGALHPKLLDSLDLQEDVFVFQIELSALYTEERFVFQPISKYPSIRRDLSLLMDRSVTAGQLEQWIKQCVPEPWLKSYTVFDVYQGEGIAPDKKSMAIALIFQDKNRTLTDSEINPVMDSMVNQLKIEYGISLREAT